MNEIEMLQYIKERERERETGCLYRIWILFFPVCRLINNTCIDTIYSGERAKRDDDDDDDDTQRRCCLYMDGIPLCCSHHTYSSFFLSSFMLMQLFLIVFFSGAVDDAPCVPFSAHVCTFHLCNGRLYTTRVGRFFISSFIFHYRPTPLCSPMFSCIYPSCAVRHLRNGCQNRWYIHYVLLCF